MSTPVLFHKYASVNEARIYKNEKIPGDGQRFINRLLMGTWVGITEESGDCYHVRTAGRDGWILKDEVSDDMGLKMFFLDVGQGDAVLIEFGDKRILVDAGPNSNMKNYLTRWQYTYLLSKGEKIHFDYVFISHFDFDHYAGSIDMINDHRFTFGTIYHNGIARFGDRDERPGDYDTELGKTEGRGRERRLLTTFDSISDLRRLNEKGGFADTFQSFFNAVDEGVREGRVGDLKRASYRSWDIGIDSTVAGGAVNGAGKKCEIQFLGPVYDRRDGEVVYKWFSSASRTRNGHSIILKIKYEGVSVLLTGDLNSASQKYLIERYGGDNPFHADVTKCCHHGSSDFDTDFLALVSPFATVISSGDNESHSHPRADAIGAAGKYSRGRLPKVYSTELARSVNGSGKVLYGMINLRSLGDQVYMAQMKESRMPDLWDSYSIIEGVET